MKLKRRRPVGTKSELAKTMEGLSLKLIVRNAKTKTSNEAGSTDDEPLCKARKKPAAGGIADGDALKKLKMKNTQESSKKVRVYATSENPERQKADSERRARIRAKKWEATAARSRSHQLRPNMRETRLMEYDEDNIQEIKARVYADNEEEDIYEDSDSDERSRNHENSKRRYENKEGGDSSKKRMRQDSSDDDSEG